MKDLMRTMVGVIGCGALAMACAGADFEEQAPEALESVGPLGTLEQPLCENKGGTNSVMTAIAVAAGRELRRWKPEADFKWNTSTGRLELSSTAAARCGGAGCRNTQALLDMQKPEASGKVTFPGNIKLDSALLRQQLKTGWNAQMSCNSSGTCAAPEHDLRYTHVENGSCDKKFFYDPLRAGSSTRLSVPDADRLKNKLKFVGYPTNKMLNFYVRDGQVSVDPTYGLNEGASSSAGSCDAACTKFSTSDVTGRCCSCNGASKKFVKSTFSSALFLCSG